MKLNSSKAKSNLIFWGVLILIFGFLFFTDTGKNTKDWLSAFALSAPNTFDKVDKTQISQDWFIEGTNGKKIRLLAEKKPTVINIWATWCPPCRSELPSLISLAKKYEDKVNFLYISQNESLEKLKIFADKKGYSFPFYTQNSAMPKELMTGTYPTTFIIDKNKNIILKSIGAHNWDSPSVHQTLDNLIK